MKGVTYYLGIVGWSIFGHDIHKDKIKEEKSGEKNR